MHGKPLKLMLHGAFYSQQVDLAWKPQKVSYAHSCSILTYLAVLIQYTHNLECILVY